MKKIIQPLLLINVLTLISPVSAETLTANQVLQKVVNHYPSLKTAALQVRRAQQENAKVQSQLGWQLAAQGGVSHDTTLFGTGSDKLDVSGSLSRQLDSGANLSFGAGLAREDADTVLSPQSPNPSTTSSIDITYRQPLEKGAGNPGYEQGLLRAEASVLVAKAEKSNLYDQIAGQVYDIYYSAASTQARIENLKQGIKRTQRLYDYIEDRASLGVSEDKDLLQVVAQLRSREAELKGLQVAWQQQTISLNRLMGREWNAKLKTNVKPKINPPIEAYEALLNEVNQYSPELQAIKAQLKLADAAIETSRDQRKDNLDLVLFVGNRTISGDAVSSNIDESEVVGGVRLEFNQGIDKSGFDAELYQAQLDRSIALQNQIQVMEDLKYDLSSLLAELKVANTALSAYRQSVKSENEKLKEATDRYKRGRTDTDQLIQFENELAAAELAYELQRLELERREVRLALLRGVVWRSITWPDYQLPELDIEREHK